MTGNQDNALLLAALKRAGEPMDSGSVLDAAAGLAESEGWAPAQVSRLTRKSVSKRLQNMVANGVLVQQGKAFDGPSGRMTPKYAPKDGYDAKASIPEPPSGLHHDRATAYDGMTKLQLHELLAVQDDMLECMGRFMSDLRTTTSKARQRLLASGLGER